ncbi:MAG: flagellar hook-associated protein FlgL [Fimbriimonadaceae bacterium]|nr:flagellar hook-associated protein FlgL [Fimbriimonadaceae bacterium]
MRISTGYQFGVQNDRISRTQTSLFEAQSRVTSGKRVATMSDDAATAGRGLTLRKAVSSAERYMANIEGANRDLKRTDSALDEANAILRRAYELAVKGSNGTADQTSRDGMVSEVEGLRKRLLDVANSKGANGQFLFAGRATDTKPFSLNDGAPVYHGDGGQVLVEAEAGETIAANVPGESLFGEAFAALKTIEDALRSGDATKLGEEGVAAAQSQMRRITQVRGEVGSRIQNLEAMSANHQRRIDDFTKAISDGEDVDLSQAITDYQAAELAYTAALQVTSRTLTMGLMDFLTG